MRNNDEPSFFELTPFELWCIEELDKATKQFRKLFLKSIYALQYKRFPSY